MTANYRPHLVNPPSTETIVTTKSDLGESHEADQEKEDKEGEEEEETTVSPDQEGGAVRGYPAPSTASLEKVGEANIVPIACISSCAIQSAIQSASQRAGRAVESSYERLAELEAFKKENGHCDVPQNYGPLGNW